jgi:predicted signal transduction protein with EAL and GGDEF domain
MMVHDDGLRVFILRVLMLMPMVMIVLMLMMTMFVAVIMPVFMTMVMVVMVPVLMMMVVIVMIVAFNALFASRATASSTHKFSPENYSISICLICMLSPLSTRRLWLWQCGHPASCADTVMA